MVEGDERDVDSGGRETEPRRGRMTARELEDGHPEREKQHLDRQGERRGRLLRMADHLRGRTQRQDDDDRNARTGNSQLTFASGVNETRIDRRPEAALH